MIEEQWEEEDFWDILLSEKDDLALQEREEELLEEDL